MKIFINPGHGGKDPGAVGKNGTKEAQIVAEIAEILRKRLVLNAYPVEVYQQNRSLSEVAAKENVSKSTLFISIHCNSHKKTEAHGLEVWYYEGSYKGMQLARIMQEQLVNGTGLTDRGIKSSAGLYVLRKTIAPAILIELPFISNPIEEQYLLNNKKKLADCIWEAIKIYNREGMI